MKTANVEIRLLKGSIIFLMISALFMTSILFTSFWDDQTSSVESSMIFEDEDYTLLTTWYNEDQGTYEIPNNLYPVGMNFENQITQTSEDNSEFQEVKNNS